jgi:hypothetical protein
MKTTSWTDLMPFYILGTNQSVATRCSELYWVAIMFIGYPLFAICEWIHWEIYGIGPRKK